MEISSLIPHIESLIFASDKPLTSAEITDLLNNAFGFMEDKVIVEQVDAAIEGIVEKYSAEFYPFEVKESGGGWQFLTKKEFHKTVAQLNGEKFLKRLSAAALETLAIVAYKQPVTKGEIESIRGVSSDYAVQKLLEKELIIISGRNERLPGHPLVYATSKNFMDYFGINSPEDLPKIKEVLAEQLIAPTVVNQSEFEQSDVLAVSDTGELILADDTTDDVAGSPLDKKSEPEPDLEGEVSNPFDNNEDLPAEKESESLEDEIAEEEFISDEIFVAEDKLEEEEKIDEELSADDEGENNSSDDDATASGNKEAES